MWRRRGRGAEEPAKGGLPEQKPERQEFMTGKWLGRERGGFLSPAAAQAKAESGSQRHPWDPPTAESGMRERGAGHARKGGRPREDWERALGTRMVLSRCGVPPNPSEVPPPGSESPVGSQLYQNGSKIMGGPGGEEGEMKRNPEGRRLG